MTTNANTRFCELLEKYGSIEALYHKVKGEELELLLENPRLIVWSHFSKNNQDKAVEFLLQQHPDKIDWFTFSSNNNDNAVDYLLLNKNKINMHGAAKNKNQKMRTYCFINNQQEKPDFGPIDYSTWKITINNQQQETDFGPIDCSTWKIAELPDKVETIH